MRRKTAPRGVCYHGAMKRVISAIGILSFLAAAAIWFAPFHASSTLRRAALWGAGVRRSAAGPLRAYERNSCRPSGPCRCTALIHGMGDSSLTWDKTLLDDAAGSPGTFILAVDMPGTGGSLPAADCGIRAQARILRSALEARCPEWTVAGNSLGGWLAGWLAVDWPEGVRRLVLVNAAGLSDPSGVALQAARTLADPTIQELKKFDTRAYGRPRSIPERAWPAAVAAIRSRPTGAIFAALKAQDLLDARLKDVKADTVIVWGAADRVLPADFAERFRRGIPGSRLESVPGCGHLPQQECPEIVSRVLFGAFP